MPHPIIILEGPDGVGKTTISKLLTDRLKADLLICPGSTPLGLAVRSVLKSGEKFNSLAMTLAFAAADLDVSRQAEEIVERKPVVMDRSMLSNYIYRKAQLAWGLQSGTCVYGSNEHKDLASSISISRNLLGSISRALPEKSYPIFLDASDSQLQYRRIQRNDPRKDPFDDLSAIAAIEYRSAYRDSSLFYGLNVQMPLQLDTSSLDPHQVVERIVHLLSLS